MPLTSDATALDAVDVSSGATDSPLSLDFWAVVDPTLPWTNLQTFRCDDIFVELFVVNSVLQDTHFTVLHACCGQRRSQPLHIAKRRYEQAAFRLYFC